MAKKDVALYTPCLNGPVFKGMVRLKISADGPEWGGPGNYVLESDYDRQHDELMARIGALQRALSFWIPQSFTLRREIVERVMDDLLLLIGEQDFTEETAEDKGWIGLLPKA